MSGGSSCTDQEDNVRRQFELMMDKSGPFESNPHLVVGVSGGADSMALVLLIEEWANAHGGQVTALTVDHGLRQNSSTETKQVSRWLASRPVEHIVLHWEGPKPDSAVQASARKARYQLMADWCHENAALHLFVAHTLDDQVETYLMRKRRGSQDTGLSGMSAVTEMAGCRLLRPLLTSRGSALRDWLRQINQQWIEDPSNKDRKYERVRMRQLITDSDLDPMELFGEAADYGNQRRVGEAVMAELMASSVMCHPAGFVRMAIPPFMDQERSLIQGTLSRILVCVGGGEYPVSPEKLMSLGEQFRTGKFGGNVTLGGCLICKSDDQVVICRENRNLPAAISPRSDAEILWDGRYRLKVKLQNTEAGQICTLAPLGETGWKQINSLVSGQVRAQIPHAVRLTIPALFDDQGVSSAPLLDYKSTNSWANFAKLQFLPLNALSGSGFAVAHFN